MPKVKKSVVKEKIKAQVKEEVKEEENSDTLEILKGKQDTDKVPADV